MVFLILQYYRMKQDHIFTTSKCLTPFHNTLRLLAATIVRFYSKCTLDRIHLEIADKVSLILLFLLLLIQ